MARTRWPNAGAEPAVKRPAEAASLEATPGAVIPGAATGVVGWSRRIALGLAGASFGPTAASVVDALWGRTAVTTQSVPFLPLARLDVGLNAPVALALGACVGLFGWVVEPDRSRSPSELWRALLLPDLARRRRLAACIVPVVV